MINSQRLRYIADANFQAFHLFYRFPVPNFFYPGASRLYL
ncbi:hypothetical protein HMPREF9413_5104 [Paenibacillus sp. HGF7]|nr:hypothetical protein HMPREF9413_5104 [Paenibacillus sp. HGF7]